MLASGSNERGVLTEIISAVIYEPHYAEGLRSRSRTLTTGILQLQNQHSTTTDCLLDKVTPNSSIRLMPNRQKPDDHTQLKPS